MNAKTLSRRCARTTSPKGFFIESLEQRVLLSTVPFSEGIPVNLPVTPDLHFRDLQVTEMNNDGALVNLLLSNSGSLGWTLNGGSGEFGDGEVTFGDSFRCWFTSGTAGSVSGGPIRPQPKTTCAASCMRGFLC